MARYKLVIVEDEQLAREGIRGAVERGGGDFVVAGEAENGVQGLELIRAERPDVVITDISMPKMDGLELIEEAREEVPDAVFVIVSGYDDFSYAQRAIRFGVQEYLLKPVLPDQIRAALAKVAAGIEKRRSLARGTEELEKRLRESLPLQRERFLGRLLHGDLSEGEIDETARFLDLDFRGDFFAAALFRVGVGGPSDAAGPEAEAGADLRRQELNVSALGDLAGEIFTSHFSWYLLPLSASHVALMVGVRGLTEEKAFAYLGQAARRIAAGLGKGLGVPVHASFGNLRSSAVGIRESYAEAREALDFCFARESGTVLPYADLAVAAAAEGPRPAGLEEEFILSVKLCDRVQCARRIEELERFYRGKGASDPRLIKMDLLEILIHLFDRLGPASEAGEELRTLRISVYAELEKSDSLTDLFGRLKDLSARLMDAVERLRNSSSISRVEKVKELVEAHLADPDLFMDEVASRVFVSPNYLRGIFKQQTGESFVEYLTRRRMETAAELLRDPTIQVQDIAERVGYPNQRYFSVCFKKVHGCSPSEYRSLHARGTRD